MLEKKGSVFRWTQIMVNLKRKTLERYNFLSITNS